MVYGLEIPMLKRLFLSLICATLAMACVPASAQQIRHPHGYYGDGVQPLDRILPQIRSGHPGRFYDAEGPFADPYGGWHYRVKWLTPDGRVVWYDADARTGRVVGLPGNARPYLFGPAPPGYAVPRIYGGPPRRYYGGPPRGFIGPPRGYRGGGFRGPRGF
jgi:hypothetical protein